MKRLRKFVILALALCMAWAMSAAVIAAEPDAEGVTSTFTFTNRGATESEPEPEPEPTPEPEAVDKTALEKEYASDYALNESDYTPESWAPFEEALSNAAEVLADPDATQGEVDEALAGLVAARADLVKAEAASPKTGDGNPDGNTGGTGNTGDKGGTGGTGSTGGTGDTGSTEGGGETGTTSAQTGDIGTAPFMAASAAAAACIAVLLGVGVSRKRRYGKEGR